MMKLSSTALLLLLASSTNAFVPLSQQRSVAIPKPLSATPVLEEEGTDILLKLKRSIKNALWPGSQPDPSASEPLPPGSLGCPFFGSDGFLSGNKKDGPGCFFPQQSAREGHANIVKFYFMGAPVASVSGAKLVNQLTRAEFSQTEALSPTYNDGNAEKEVPSVFGNDNLLFERNKDKHAFLRRLVGAGMTAKSVALAFPIIKELTHNRIHTRMTNDVSAENPLKLETVCAEYTLDVTQKQILGLDLPPEEVATFRSKMVTWLDAMYSPVANLNIPWIVKHTPEYAARHYIQDKVEGKIDDLLENGPDASLISQMLFAVDEENSQKLTRKQVLENSMLLMVTASETTAGTLTMMMFLLGLHPDKYQKVVEEQKAVMAKFGTEITQDILENHCPYLNAVKQETMRMGALTGGYPKRATETIKVDGIQIPKGWSVFCNVRLTHMLDPVTRLPDNSHMCVHRGFQPERWFEEETTPTDFMPFGSGPRYCIGAPLANLEIQLFLATMARRVESFDLLEDYTGQKPVVWNPSTLTPRPIDGVAVQRFETV